ncbi:MAG: ABC transporter ATP-binding protein [Planctomycetales bacterium]|nr:ABC transporter ATP-binding protein [Planctomycetales bacterium]
MKNLGRAIRLSFKYPWTIAGAVLFSFLIAVSWGGNLAAVGPIVQVLFDEDGGKSLHKWVDEQIAQATEKIASADRELAALAALTGGDEAERLANRRQQDLLRSRQKAERAALAGYERMRPWIMKLPRDPFLTLVWIVGALVVITLLKDVFLVISNMLTDRIANKVAYDMRNEFYAKAVHLDIATFSEKAPAEWISRMTNDVNGVSVGLRTFYGRFVREPLKAVACIAGAMYICWRLFVVSLVMAPISAFMIQRLTTLLKRASRRALEEVAQVYNVLTETFGSQKIVKAFTMEQAEKERFQRNTRTLYSKQMKIAWYSSLIRPASEMMGILIVAMAVLSGAYLWLNQETHLGVIKICDRPLSLPMLLAFFGFLAGISDPARKLSDVIGHVQNAAAACDRVYEMMDMEPTVVEPDDAKPLARHQTDVVYRGVHFSYRPDQPVLNNVHLRITAGETIAVVGPNGCGKSTLASLLMRFYDPQSGHVDIDGTDVRECRLADLRGQIGLVTQEAVLFNETIMNNIRYGSPQATDEQVIAAAKQAHAHRFITEKLEHGYDTEVGANGNRLSGGQRQRIALARAILRDPAILILDEATSQVDMESEQLIQRTLAEFTRNRTTIIITHRMGVLALADRIIVMDHGQIVDQGDHHDLIQRCDIYQRLYKADFRQTA